MQHEGLCLSNPGRQQEGCERRRAQHDVQKGVKGERIEKRNAVR